MQSPSPVDALVDALVRDTPAIAAAAAATDGGRRVLIGIAGVPGSGKSTIAAAAAARLVARGVASVALPMDGFHYSRAQLDAMPNAAEAHRCRGADWTFDAHGLLELLTRVRTAPLGAGAQPILAPSFDHALKDPTPDSIAIAASDRVVLVEGLYLHSGAPVWRDMAALFDRTWWVSCPIDVAMERVARRHVAAGICANLAEAIARVDGNDRPNALAIERNRLPALHTIINA